MSNLSTTRQALTVMRDMRDMFPRENRSRGVNARVELSRAYGKRRYFLTYEGPLFVSTLVMYDAQENSLYVRPQTHDRGVGNFSSDRARAFASQTNTLDRLFSVPGITFAKGSETPETLQAFRNTPTA
jgi:hypothetical protein